MVIERTEDLGVVKRPPPFLFLVADRAPQVFIHDIVVVILYYNFVFGYLSSFKRMLALIELY